MLSVLFFVVKQSSSTLLCHLSVEHYSTHKQLFVLSVDFSSLDSSCHNAASALPEQVENMVKKKRMKYN